MNQDKILVWLPSPMGDAILCTPALGALRKRFPSQRIYFLTNNTTKALLSPPEFNDHWVLPDAAGVFALAGRLRKYTFSKAILFKNSFGAALTVFLAGIGERIGYARDGRSPLLTGKIQPEKTGAGRFRPLPMIDYYLKIAEFLGARTDNRQTHLPIDPNDHTALAEQMPHLFSPSRPLVILVPAGAFGPSKCWPADRFAQTADRLIEEHNANIVISVAPNDSERAVAQKISSLSKNTLLSLADHPLSMGLLKALFAGTDLVITNDTGPRHIAIALQKKVITLFGPNNPAWTYTCCPHEIQIRGTAPCAPCEKPKCARSEHLCMNSITVEAVCTAADNLLTGTEP